MMEREVSERETMERRPKKDENAKRQRAVPRFASFTPVPAPAPETRPASDEARVRRDEKKRHGGPRDDDRRRRDGGGGRERIREREREGDRGRDRGRDRDREKDREREREKDRGKDGNREREREKERDRHREKDRDRGRDDRVKDREKDRGRDDRVKDREKDTDGLFVYDKRGDPLILQYGTNDRAKVPSYRRFGRGSIIGSPGFLTIHRDAATEQFSIRVPGDGPSSTSAFRDKALIAAANRLPSRRVHPSPAPLLPTTHPDDFIPLTSKKRKRSLSHESDTSSSSASSSRSPSPSPPPSDPPTTSASTPSPKPLATTLTTHLRKSPSDIPAWLHLIALQQPLFFPHTTTTPNSLTPDETKSLAKLRLNLYQQALSHASSTEDRERLVLGMMKEGGKVWGEEVSRRKWEEVVAELDTFELWRGRVDFEMGRAAFMGVEGVRGLMVREMSRLVEVLAGGGGEVECERAVYVFLRVTQLLWDAGFGELAVAAWQAVLETVFCRPVVSEGGEVGLGLFGEFWESEVPRMGEEGAQGWRQFVEAREEMAEPPEARRDVPVEVSGAADPLQAWAAVEEQAAARANMPARTLDEGTDDDPFRVVMFSDLEDLLVWFPSAVLPLVKPLLAEAFLVFCGLPPAGLSGKRFAAMLSDPFVAGRGQGLDLSLRRDDTGAPDLSRRTPDFEQQGGSMAISPEILFSGDSWFHYLGKWSGGQPQVDVSWVLRTLGYLVKDCGMEGLAEYFLALSWRNEQTGARKVAKGLLKQYSTNIRLYNAYALVEWANGNSDVSHKVLSSATGLARVSQDVLASLTATNTRQSSASSDGQMLWNTWAWLHLDSGQQEMALTRLCSSTSPISQPAISPALLLKTKSHLSSTRDYSLSSQQPETAAQHAESLMLLEYLAADGGREAASPTQGNITAALATVHTFSREASSRNLSHSPHHERLIQSAARLLYHHATHGYAPSPFPPLFSTKRTN